MILSSLQDRMIRPGEAVDAVHWRLSPGNQPVIDQLRRGIATDFVNMSICYCSVFDECWTRNDEDRQPMSVKQCLTAKVPYRQ